MNEHGQALTNNDGLPGDEDEDDNTDVSKALNGVFDYAESNVDDDATAKNLDSEKEEQDIPLHIYPPGHY